MTSGQSVDSRVVDLPKGRIFVGAEFTNLEIRNRKIRDHGG